MGHTGSTTLSIIAIRAFESFVEGKTNFVFPESMGVARSDCPEEECVDIRLCIDYNLVGAVTSSMEYTIPLVDDRFTDLKNYQCFCSPDAVSGFWAVMMTAQVRHASAFVNALKILEWLRSPFGLKNSPMIYQQLIENALGGMFS